MGSELSCASAGSRECAANLRFRKGGDLRREEPGWRIEGSLSARRGAMADSNLPASNEERMQLMLRGARSIFERYNLSIGLRAAWGAQAATSGSLSTQLATRLGRHFSLRLGVEKAFGQEQLDDTRFVMSLSTLFDGARQSLQFDADSLDNVQATRWQFNAGQMHTGYSSALGLSDSDFGRNVDANASYRQERFGGDFSVVRAMPTAGVDASESRITLRSAVVFADGQMGLTERVLGSFGLVVPEDGAAAGAVYVNPVDDDYLASSLGVGPAVVPSLRAYEARMLVLSLPDLAPNRDPGELFPVVMPGYKGGVVIRAGGAPTVSIEAHVLKADGTAAEFISGHFERADDPVRRAVFTGRGGRLRATGLAAGKWTLVLETNPRTQHRVTLGDGAGGVIDLGVLKP